MSATEEERRAAKRRRDARYRRNNAAKLKAKRADYYQANRETLLAKQVIYDRARTLQKNGGIPRKPGRKPSRPAHTPGAQDPT